MKLKPSPNSPQVTGVFTDAGNRLGWAMTYSDKVVFTGVNPDGNATEVSVRPLQPGRVKDTILDMAQCAVSTADERLIDTAARLKAESEVL